jgi:two-component system NtrC family sensor kinase
LKTDTLEKAFHDLKATQDQLIRSERLYSMGRLAASITHEIANPLQVVRTRLELAVEDMDLGLPLDPEDLGVANREIERAIQILQGLQNLQRPSEEAETAVDVNSALQDVLALMGKQIRRQGVTLSMDLSSDLPPVRGRSNQLKQVFLNLLLNALEAMPQGGQLRVATALDSEGWVTLTFVDTGAGIPPPKLERIFEPFFTTKEQGLGLGLAVCLTIIEAHGGRIDVDSEPGVGTCLRVKLPASQRRSNGQADTCGSDPHR